jgi:hypothetical protein
MKRIALLFIILCGRMISQTYTAGSPLNEYHDVIPDSLMNYVYHPYTHETFSLNIFNKGGFDIEFVAHGAASSGGSSGYMMVRSLNPEVSIRFGRWDSVYVPATTNYNVTKVALPLKVGDVINAPGAKWDSTSLYLTDHSGSGGGNKNVNDFVGGDKFIGLRYLHKDYFNGDTELYGWIWVQCPSEDSCYVKSYAASRIGAVNVQRVSSEQLHAFPNPATNGFYLSPAESLQSSAVKMYDILGREIDFKSTLSKDGYKISFDQGTPDGYYIVKIITGTDERTLKVVKAER